MGEEKQETSESFVDPLEEAAKITAEVFASMSAITTNPRAMEPMHFTLIVAQTAALVDIAKSLRVMAYEMERTDKQ